MRRQTRNGAGTNSPLWCGTLEWIGVASHGAHRHSTVYEETFHVPLVLRITDATGAAISDPRDAARERRVGSLALVTFNINECGVAPSIRIEFHHQEQQ
jgi:hypothetical protein